MSDIQWPKLPKRLGPTHAERKAERTKSLGVPGFAGRAVGPSDPSPSVSSPTGASIPNAVHDVEISMHAFRLMRSGRYLKAEALRQALAEDFPGVDAARIDACLRRLATKLHEHQS